MRLIALTIAALATLSVVVPANAQMSARTKTQLDQMRQQDQPGFDACQQLAISRGYNMSDRDDAETGGMALMNFIKGCVAMRQR